MDHHQNQFSPPTPLSVEPYVFWVPNNGAVVGESESPSTLLFGSSPHTFQAYAQRTITVTTASRTHASQASCAIMNRLKATPSEGSKGTHGHANTFSFVGALKFNRQQSIVRVSTAMPLHMYITMSGALYREQNPDARAKAPTKESNGVSIGFSTGATRR